MSSLLSPETRPYGQLTLSERLHVLAVSAGSGLNTVNTFTSYITSSERHMKTWKRAQGESDGRYVTARLNIPELQSRRPATYLSYTRFIQETGLEPNVDILGSAKDAAAEVPTSTGPKLLWIGRKRYDRVILYIHGGGYIMAMNKASLYFWKYIQKELKFHGLPVGIAALGYTVYPDGPFPAVLSEIVKAVNYLLSSGVEPQNLYIAGDSAGGNAVLQLVSHILHPGFVKSVPPLNLSASLAGVILISPWVVLSTDAPSYAENKDNDAVSPDALGRWGAALIRQTSEEEYLPFLEPGTAGNGWFNGINTIIERVFVTAGQKECMRDDITRFGGVLKKHYASHEKSEDPHRDGSDLIFLIEKDGVHDHSLVDFEVGETHLVETMDILINWLVVGILGQVKQH